jgi:hypothetical protein
MANAPLVGRDGGINKSVSTKWRSRIFLQTGLDTRIDKPPDGQISRPVCPSSWLAHSFALAGLLA